MRWLSALLVFCLSYTFAHEALCHGGALDILAKCFSHVGSQHDHDCHGHTGHDHQSHHTDHDKDHHDDEEHDHQLKILFVKKDPSSYRRMLLSQAAVGVQLISDSSHMATASLFCHPVIPSAESFIPGYLCSHVLRL
jgi:hypothetical protein